MELAELGPDEQKAFLADLGLSDTALPRFVRAACAALDLISFLTAGPDECRAWTIRRGTNAVRAAGKIHSDIERGFIRAEVMTFDDFMTYKSEAKVREAGKADSKAKSTSSATATSSTSATTASQVAAHDQRQLVQAAIGIAVLVGFFGRGVAGGGVSGVWPAALRPGLRQRGARVSGLAGSGLASGFGRRLHLGRCRARRCRWCRHRVLSLQAQSPLV